MSWFGDLLIVALRPMLGSAISAKAGGGLVLKDGCMNSLSSGASQRG
ncbi:hypothetical protein [Aeromonas sobria]